jgi:hypothetical protein
LPINFATAVGRVAIRLATIGEQVSLIYPGRLYDCIERTALRLAMQENFAVAGDADCERRVCIVVRWAACHIALSGPLHIAKLTEHALNAKFGRIVAVCRAVLDASIGSG